jgi:hypothetical protein
MLVRSAIQALDHLSLMQHSKHQKMLTTAMMFSLSSNDLNIKSALKSFIAIYDYVWLSNMKEYINLRWDS